jgi:hypothetical protein
MYFVASGYAAISPLFDTRAEAARWQLANGLRATTEIITF